MSDSIRPTIFNDYPTVKAAVSTKAFDSMKKEDGTHHYANILKFVKTADIPGLTICMNQVHGGTVAVVENERELIIPKTDGIVTKNKRLTLGILTADCLPILLYDPVKDVIGAAHAGSKGLLKNIIGNTIKAFVTNFESDPSDIIAYIGPSIEQQCYVVGKELIDLYKTAFQHYNSVYIEGNGTFFLDLRSVALQDLKAQGLRKENIEISKLCTKCNPDTLYSYRNGDTNGRFISVIGFTHG